MKKEARIKYRQRMRKQAIELNASGCSDYIQIEEITNELVDSGSTGGGTLIDGEEYGGFYVEFKAVDVDGNEVDGIIEHLYSESGGPIINAILKDDDSVCLIGRPIERYAEELHREYESMR